MGGRSAAGVNVRRAAARFTTFERIQLRDMVVVKKSGKREPFDRDKLARSVEIACRKRPIEPQRIERLVNGVVRRLESSGESELGVGFIGEMVMEGLQALDPVAYIRFASVYRDFREARDFETFVGSLGGATVADVVSIGSRRSEGE